MDSHFTMKANRLIDFVMRDYPELWYASPLAMGILSAGVMWVLVSIITDFQIPASGAVLVCSAIVAEVLLRKSAWLHAANHAGHNPLRYMPVMVMPRQPEQQWAFHVMKGDMDRQGAFSDYFDPEVFEILPTLERTARKTDFDMSGGWRIHLTANRIETNLSWLIIGASLSGTLI